MTLEEIEVPQDPRRRPRRRARKIIRMRKHYISRPQTPEDAPGQLVRGRRRVG